MMAWAINLYRMGAPYWPFIRILDRFYYSIEYSFDGSLNVGNVQMISAALHSLKGYVRVY